MSALLEPRSRRAARARPRVPRCPSGPTVLDELRATEYGRLDARGDVYLDYTGGSLYAESQVEEHLRLLRDGVFGNPHSANPTSSAATALVERARAAVLRYFNARPRRVRLHLHAERHRRAAPRRRGVSVRPGAGSSPRPTTTTRSTASASSPARAGAATRTCRSRRPICASATRLARSPRREAAGPQPLRLSRAVELLRRQASAGVDRPGPRAGLGRAARLRRVRADEPARPVGVAAGLRRDLLLQDVRLPDGPGRADRAAPRARAPAAAVVQRRHRRRRQRAGRHGRAARRPCGLRGRHRGLPRASRRWRSACATSSGSASTRSRERVETPRQLAARDAAAAAARRREPRDPHLRAGTWDRRGRHDRVQLPAPGRAGGRRAVRRPRRGGARHLAADGLLLQPRRRRGRVLALEGAAGRAGSRRAWSSTTTSRASACRRAGRSASRSGIATNFADVSRFMAFAAEFADLTDVPSDLPPRLAC